MGTFNRILFIIGVLIMLLSTVLTPVQALTVLAHLISEVLPTDLVKQISNPPVKGVVLCPVVQ